MGPIWPHLFFLMYITKNAKNGISKNTWTGIALCTDSYIFGIGITRRNLYECLQGHTTSVFVSDPQKNSKNCTLVRQNFSAVNVNWLCIHNMILGVTWDRFHLSTPSSVRVGK